MRQSVQQETAQDNRGSVSSILAGWSVHWRSLVILAVLTCLYWDVVRELVFSWWKDPSASYGFAVPPIALWLAWTRRDALFSRPLRADPRGLLVMLAAGVALVAGELAAEHFLGRLSLVVILCGLIWTFWGPARLGVLAFPLLMLGAMIPLPAVIYSRVAVPLQMLASTTATDVIQLAGGTVHRDGNILHLPGLTLGVVEACSGLRSVAAILILSLLLGYSYCARSWERLLVIGLAIPLAIAVNVLRIVGTVLLAMQNQDLAMGFYHSFSGWLVFLGSSGILLVVSRRLGSRARA